MWKTKCIRSIWSLPLIDSDESLKAANCFTSKLIEHIESLVQKFCHVLVDIQKKYKRILVLVPGNYLQNTDWFDIYVVYVISLRERFILDRLSYFKAFKPTLRFLSPTHNLMAFTTGVTNAHGPSPQSTACRSPSCSLVTATESNEA